MIEIGPNLKDAIDKVLVGLVLAVFLYVLHRMAGL